jgi:hypothetical protein
MDVVVEVLLRETLISLVIRALMNRKGDSLHRGSLYTVHRRLQFAVQT